MELPPEIMSFSPDVMSGAQVFAGTRVPIKNMLDYLGGGQTLEEFMEDFPTVSEAQIFAVLESLSESLSAARLERRSTN